MEKRLNKQLSRKAWRLAKRLLDKYPSKSFIKVPANLRGESGGQMVIVTRGEVEIHFAKPKIVGRVSNKARKAYKTAKWAERRMRSLEKGIEKAVAVAKLRRMRGEVHVCGRGIKSLMREYRKYRSILKRALRKLGAEDYLNGITVDVVIALKRGLELVKAAGKAVSQWWRQIRTMVFDQVSFAWAILEDPESAVIALDWAQNHRSDKFKEMSRIVRLILQ